MYTKSVLFIGCLFGFYALLITNTVSGWLAFATALGLGFTQAFIGFNVGHDAIHRSYSSKQSTNNLMSIPWNLMGASVYMWDIMHNKVHHTHTNILGADEDLEVAPGLIKLSPKDKRTNIMKYQHVYAFLLYGLSTVAWVFKKDYQKYFAPNIGSHSNANHKKGTFVKILLVKLVYYVNFIVLPLIFMEITWWQFLIGFFSMHFVEGLTLGLVFQLAHVVEGVEFVELNEDRHISDAWAIHQMKTTANFSCDSSLAAFLCGGLNFQVEHHLFPKVCHVHYPKISKIVREIAKKHNVPYIENKTFLDALKSHSRVLKLHGSPREIEMG
ncbi:MAG: acyl-CoA desaturase [Flavobacteriales bacterium]|nr:acyl-CoA desaturase [Flavobacteriales bacterium]